MDDIEEKIEKEATTETFIRQATKCAVAKMCTNNRFEYIQESSLEILTELVLKGTRERKRERRRNEQKMERKVSVCRLADTFLRDMSQTNVVVLLTIIFLSFLSRTEIKDLGRGAKQYAEKAGRTYGTMEDILWAFEDKHVDFNYEAFLESLLEYVSTADEESSIQVNNFPVFVKRTKSSGDVDTSRAHGGGDILPNAESWFPSLPPKHTYRRQREEDTESRSATPKGNTKGSPVDQKRSIRMEISKIFNPASSKPTKRKWGAVGGTAEIAACKTDGTDPKVDTNLYFSAPVREIKAQCENGIENSE